jgi:undecaprenyl diphosphate synthase
MSKKIKHLAIIMDGNRRWARVNNLKTIKGHLNGQKTLEKVLNWCKEADISILTLYAFSNENWQRPKEEVDFLMKAFYLAFSRDIEKLNKNNIKVRVIGDLKNLPEKLQKVILKAMDLTKNNNDFILNLAINYSGRLEIVQAVNKALESSRKIDEDSISQNLYTANLPDPDLIIRTSGEKRLSGFLLWQSAYSELVFVKNYWPDFSKIDFDLALEDFYQRQRRFGS